MRDIADPQMDPKIWKLALLVIERHRTGAGDFATSCAKLAFREGDERRCRFWVWIKRHIDAFLRPKPDEGEAVH